MVTISSKIVGETGDLLRAAAPFLYLAADTRSHGRGGAVIITLLWMITRFLVSFFKMITSLFQKKIDSFLSIAGQFQGG